MIPLGDAVGETVGLNGIVAEGEAVGTAEPVLDGVIFSSSPGIDSVVRCLTGC